MRAAGPLRHALPASMRRVDLGSTSSRFLGTGCARATRISSTRWCQQDGLACPCQLLLQQLLTGFVGRLHELQVNAAETVTRFTRLSPLLAICVSDLHAIMPDLRLGCVCDELDSPLRSEWRRPLLLLFTTGKPNTLAVSSAVCLCLLTRFAGRLHVAA